MRLRSVGFAATLAAALVQSCQPACEPPPPVAAPAPPTSVIVDGQGSGHGRGLSAWGTYGLAVHHGWPWQSILDHYYQGTGWGTRGNGPIRVRLMALDNSATTGVISTTGTAIWNGGAYGALQAVHQGSNTYDVYGYGAPACPGAAVAWTWLGRVNGPVVFSTTQDQTGAGSGDVLGLCQPNGSVIHYRGTITALNDANGFTRTVNELAVENYLKGVVSREVSSSWGNAGGGAGMHALWAFSVAARSFALAQGRYSYAQTCDTTSCQVYGGSAYRADPTAATSHPRVAVCEPGNLTFECANTNRAVDETAGVVRQWGDGRVVSTEYSSSHGPYSAGGSFPPVDDWFSNVPQNGNYQWTRTLDAAGVASRYGLGELTGAYTERDANSIYHGVWGNRVVLQGTAGTVVVSAWDFRNAFGLPSPGITVRAA